MNHRTGYEPDALVRHNLIIDTEKRALIHLHRRDRDLNTVGILRDGARRLDPPGLRIDIPDILVGL